LKNINAVPPMAKRATGTRIAAAIVPAWLFDGVGDGEEPPVVDWASEVGTIGYPTFICWLLT